MAEMMSGVDKTGDVSAGGRMGSMSSWSASWWTGPGRRCGMARGALPAVTPC